MKTVGWQQNRFVLLGVRVSETKHPNVEWREVGLCWPGFYILLFIGMSGLFVCLCWWGKGGAGLHT